VDLADDVRPREREDVGASLQLARVVREARAAGGGLVQPVRLDHRPHPSVQDDDPLGEGGRRATGTGAGRLIVHLRAARDVG